MLVTKEQHEKAVAIYRDIARNMNRTKTAKDLAKAHKIKEAMVYVYATYLRHKGVEIPYSKRGYYIKKSALDIVADEIRGKLKGRPQNLARKYRTKKRAELQTPEAEVPQKLPVTTLEDAVVAAINQ